MRRRTWLAMAATAAVVAAGLSVLGFAGEDDYELQVLMPAAGGVHEGARVMMRGEQVGTITGLGVRGDKALATIVVDEAHAPLTAGTTARVSWESVIGYRTLDLLPGQQGNPPLPSGKMIESKIERVEIDDVLAMLDGPTRKHVQGLVKRLNETLDGREEDVNTTLKAAGPAIAALGEVMRAVGEDGPAIRDLVKRLHAMTSELARRDGELGQIVRNLGQLTSVAADKQASLKTALAELPPTVREATATLQGVPEGVDATVPLLRDLRPATEQLPQVAGNLSPVLAELRPTVADLKPTLGAARSLLGHTPGLLDSAHATLPGVKKAVDTLQPAVTFLRPYTPEVAGWLSNWTSVFATQTSGNVDRALIIGSGSAVYENPGVLPPGLRQEPRPLPGAIAGQPWDANGDGIR